MNRSIKRIFTALLAAVLSLSAVALAENSDAKTDFYAYATTQIAAEHPTPENETGYESASDYETEGWSSMSALREIVDADEKAHVSALMADPTAASDSIADQTLATAVALLGDHDARNAAGAEPLKPYVEKLMAADSVPALIDACAEVQRDTAVGFFYIITVSDADGDCVFLPSVYPSVLTMHGALGDDAFQQERDNCLDLVKRIFVKLGYGEDEAAQLAETELDFDEKLDQAPTYDGDAVTALADLDELFPALALSQSLATIGMQNLTQIDENSGIADLNRVNSMATEENLQAFKAYAVVELFANTANYLDDESVQLYKELYSYQLLGTALDDSGMVESMTTTLSSDMTADDIAALIRSNFKTEVSNNYSERNLDPDAAKLVQEDLQLVFTWYRDQINTREWMCDSSKQAALDKIDNCIVYVGAPADEDSPYHDKDADSCLALMLSGDAARQKNNFRLINEADYYRKIWLTDEAADLVNACYSQAANSIHIFTAILQPPFYSAAASKAENAAGLLFVLAHECSHAFDPVGSRYDAYGKLNDTWPQADRDAYNALMQQAVSYYQHFPYAPGKCQDTTITLAENCADLAAIRFVMDYLDNESDKQAAFEAFANVWYAAHSDGYYEALTGAPHSFARSRINGVVASVEDFYRIYGVEEGDAMFVPVEERPVIW